VKKILPLLLCTASLYAQPQPKLIGTLGYHGTQNGGSVFRFDLPGTTPGIIHAFNNQAPHSPSGGVCKGDGIWLYGITGSGGTAGAGAFYRIQQNGTQFTKLYDFASPAGFRAIPFFHTDDVVYFRDGSAIRKYNTLNGTLTSIAGNSPVQSRNLYIDADDWMYFIELGFPARLVKMKTDGTLWMQLHSFSAATDGDLGEAGVTETPGDSLFGVNRIGGVNGGGTLYSIKKDGTGFFVHHQFNTATGINPEAKLVYFDGKLYGTTLAGGNFNHGVLFCINADGSNYRVLKHFETVGSTFETPLGNIAVSSNGRIFGALSSPVFTTNFYRLYKTDTSGTNYELFFSGNPFDPSRINGDFSQDILLLNNNSIFFTTSTFGRNDGGVLNSCDTAGAGNDIFHFGNSPNGFRPLPGIIKASDGKLYGTTSIGGASGGGVIYVMNADGTNYTKLHEFTDAQGYEPSGKLLEASDGKLYGACRYGGPNNLGCLYRINKNGTGFELIYDYSTFTSGYSPVGGLVEDISGVLYGVNFWSTGSIFKINKNGTGYTELKLFTGGTDLQFPYNCLTLWGGYLYGACGYGGAGSKGGIFRMKTDGSSYQVLHEFNGATDGELPVGRPIVASNGKIYGTAAFGGTTGDGTVFRLDTNGTNFNVLRHLSTTDGTNPWAGLIQASDGLMYGGTQVGGSGSGGTLFRFNLDGSGFNVIRQFPLATEGQGMHSLIDLNGNFVVLPVQWLSFTAQKTGSAVLLQWKTAREENSLRFEVERSGNGNLFNSIGSITAAGNTASVSAYTFNDHHPAQGTNYYRLKQVDGDGKFSYSATVSVRFGYAGAVVIGPNPVKDQLLIKLPADHGFRLISVWDAAGRRVMHQTVTGATLQLSVGHLTKGRYVLQIAGRETERHSFIKE
jgi:uncharacterized repeat protein (TIGR03803 family)